MQPFILPFCQNRFQFIFIDDFFLFLHPFRRRNFPTFQSINHMIIIPAHCFFRLLVICVRPCFPASKLFFAFKITLRQNNLVCRTRINNRICPFFVASDIIFSIKHSFSFLSCVKMARQKGGGARQCWSGKKIIYIKSEGRVSTLVFLFSCLSLVYNKVYLAFDLLRLISFLHNIL